MKIGKPGTPTDWNESKYHKVWSAVSKLPGDKWLPVTLSNAKDAMNLLRAAKYQRFTACARGTTIWIRKLKRDLARH